MNGIIFDIKEMAVHDGPGLRTTVFLKGCPLRCIWCHNPEGLSPQPQLSVRKNGCRACGLCRKVCSHADCQPFGRCLHICPQGLLSVSGKTISAEALAQRLMRNCTRQVGVTFSGGEPLMQAEFLLETVERLKGIPVAIETSGYADAEVFRRVIERMQLVYMDIKLADDVQHRKYTGVSNEPILRNLEILRKSGVPCILRTPLIPGITDTRENREAIQSLAGDLRQEWLEYNPMAGAKYSFFDMDYAYDRWRRENLC